MQVEVQGELLDCWIYMISDFREDLLNATFIEEYSSKKTPWDTAYLQHKDGDYLRTFLRNK